jgi:superfamily II DNA/RNA helicase
MSFHTLPFSDILKNHLRQLGYEATSQVTNTFLQSAWEGKNLLCVAPLGVGELEAVGLPLLQLLTTQNNAQALVLCADSGEANRLAQELQELSPHPLACSILQAKDKAPTQGCLLALPNWQIPADFTPRLLILPSLHQLPLASVQAIVERFIPQCQVLAFAQKAGAQSAWLADVAEVQSVSNTGNSATDIAQVVWPVPGSLKLRLWLNLLEQAETHRNLVVYVASTAFATRLARKLRARKIPAFSINQGRNDDRALSDQKAFLAGKAGVLITADVEIDKFLHADLQAVLHYDFPTESETYLTRVQKLSNTTQVINLLSPEEEQDLLAVEAELGRPMRRLESAQFDYNALDGTNATTDDESAEAPAPSKPARREAVNQRDERRRVADEWTEEEEWQNRNARAGKPFEWDPEIPRTWGVKHPDPDKIPMESWNPDALPEAYGKGASYRPKKQIQFVRVAYGSVGRYRFRPKGQPEAQPLGPAISPATKTGGKNQPTTANRPTNAPQLRQGNPANRPNAPQAEPRAGNRGGGSHAGNSPSKVSGKTPTPATRASGGKPAPQQRPAVENKPALAQAPTHAGDSANGSPVTSPNRPNSPKSSRNSNDKRRVGQRGGSNRPQNATGEKPQGKPNSPASGKNRRDNRSNRGQKPNSANGAQPDSQSAEKNN